MIRRIALFAAALGLASPSFAQENAWLRTRKLSTALNPDISAILDFTGQAGDDGPANGFALREAELGIQAAVDPYARADAFVAFPRGEQVELEEAYITLLNLPGGLLARGGKFSANFGRLNMVHEHERPQVDSPLVLESFLGEEGLRSEGVEVSKLFAPMGLFTELTYGVVNDLGEEEERAPETTTVLDTGGNPVEVAVQADEAAGPKRLRDFAHVAKLKTYKDLGEASNLELGVSGALHDPKAGDEKRLLGADLTFRWRPLREGSYRSFIWRTEALLSHRKLGQVDSAVDGSVLEPAATTDAFGLYTYAEYQPARRWKAGVRLDYAEDPGSRDGSANPTRAVSPYLTFTATEFNRFRLQLQARRRGGVTEQLGFLQWTTILGPHGAHPF